MKRPEHTDLIALFSSRTAIFSSKRTEPIDASCNKVIKNDMKVPPCRVCEESDPPIKV